MSDSERPLYRADVDTLEGFKRVYRTSWTVKRPETKKSECDRYRIVTVRFWGKGQVPTFTVYEHEKPEPGYIGFVYRQGAGNKMEQWGSDFEIYMEHLG